jgi:ATP-dependent HslUV protease ATP-binding subunit HslU
MPGGGDMEAKLGDMLANLPGMKGRSKRRRVRVPEARRLLEAEEAGKLVDMDGVQREAVERAEQAGIVFLDEIDKVASRQHGGGGPDVSREGVQRDLLPIVEGSTVSTKYGPVKTDHVLFIAAGAFHVAKVSDLIPELQGRFPIRVELQSLEKADFVRILTEPKNALTRQYEALLRTEGVALSFTDDAVEALAGYAAEANERAENIGARRLHTILEALLEEVSFTASERTDSEVVIDAARVRATLAPILASGDAGKYIL